MMKKLKKKLSSRAGESIAETLVALLISALALVMLAGAMTAAYRVITKSRNKLDSYYAGNEDLVNLVKNDTDTESLEGGSETVSEKVVISTSDDSGSSIIQTLWITCYRNEVFGKTPVISYKKKD